MIDYQFVTFNLLTYFYSDFTLTCRTIYCLVLSLSSNTYLWIVCEHFNLHVNFWPIDLIKFSAQRLNFPWKFSCLVYILFIQGGHYFQVFIFPDYSLTFPWLQFASIIEKCNIVNSYPLTIQWNPSCEATPFASEKWPFKRRGLSSGVEINTLMLRFTLPSGLSREGGLSSGWPLKRGSTVYGNKMRYVNIC